MSYHRVNIDGKSITETRLTAAALKPGTVAVINGSNKFEAAAAGSVGRIYVIDAAHHEGLTISDEIPQDQSAIGNYVEDGREFACLVAAATYTKDQPLTVGASGQITGGSANIVGFSQDDVVLGAAGFLRVRMRGAPTTPSVTTVTIDNGATASVKQGETLQLSATLAPSGADQSVTWTSATTGVATVDATGLVTAIANTGTSVITAKSVADVGKTDTITITATA